MFKEASLFNSPVYRWDVSNVIRFDVMFGTAINFNQEVRTWNIEKYINNSSGTNYMVSNMFANIPTFVNAGEKWNSYGAQATPPSQFWTLYRNDSANWKNENITSTTIDGTVTTYYDYTPINM